MAELAMAAIGGGVGTNERHLVLVHVDTASLVTGTADENSLCELNNGWAISPTLARLITCDADVARAVVDADGKILDIGRKSRVVPPRLDRALKCRDRYCRFPGCSNPVYTWHHIDHWADGGATDKANLIGLCKAHHYAIHDRHFIVTTTGDEVFRFLRPDGQFIPDVPRPREVWGGIEEQQVHLPITAESVTGSWQGDDLDLDAALFAIQPREERAEAS